MKPRAYVTRFARIVSNSILPDKYKKSQEDYRNRETNPSIGPETRKFYNTVLSVGLQYCNESKSLLLYPVRQTEIYILTIDGQSEICCSNQKLYKKLVKQGFLTPSSATRSLFREFAILDLNEISKQISGSQIIQVPADDSFINHFDISYVETNEEVNHFALIPCCFEDKTFVEAFFLTESLNSSILEEFDKLQLRQYTSCFNSPAELFSELCESFNL